MVGPCTLSSQSLDGLPLAWGAKAYASICRRDLWYFTDSWGSRGIFAPGLGQRLSFFVGSDEEPDLICKIRVNPARGRRYADIPGLRTQQLGDRRS